MKRPIDQATSEDIALMVYANDPRHHTGDQDRHPARDPLRRPSGVARSGVSPQR